MKKEKADAIATEFQAGIESRAITAVVDATIHVLSQYHPMDAEEAQASRERYAEFLRLLMKIDARQKKNDKE